MRSSSDDDDQVFKDWLKSDTIVNSSMATLPITDRAMISASVHDQYCAMPRSLRHVLIPPSPDPARPRSILLEPASPYSRPRWSPSSDGALSRARQSVSSIGSCSTIHTRSAPPVKSILTRHDSGISMATTTVSTRRKRKRSPTSVKFVDAPTVHYDNAVYHNSPPRSPRSPSEKQKPTRWFEKWRNKSPAPKPRPHISGPYHLSCSVSLVGAHASRAPNPKPGRLKQLWQRLTSMIG